MGMGHQRKDHQDTMDTRDNPVPRGRLLMEERHLQRKWDEGFDCGSLAGVILVFALEGIMLGGYMVWKVAKRVRGR
jgi:hypothetical protein